MDRVYANTGEERFKSCDLAKTFQRLSHLGPTQQLCSFSKELRKPSFLLSRLHQCFKIKFFYISWFHSSTTRISQIKISTTCVLIVYMDFGRKPFYQIRMKIYFNSFAQVLFLKWKKWRILFFFVLGFPEFPWQNKIFENIFLLRCFISKCAQPVTTVSGLEHNTVLNFLPLK